MSIDFSSVCNCGHTLECHWADWNSSLNCGDCRCPDFKRDNLRWLEKKAMEV